jgi:hypothetical protein
MNASAWNAAFGELARATMSSPEFEQYYSIPKTKPRAQLTLKQLSLYVRHRRDYWAHVSGNCPVLAVKQKISCMRRKLHSGSLRDGVEPTHRG